MIFFVFTYSIIKRKVICVYIVGKITKSEIDYLSISDIPSLIHQSGFIRCKSYILPGLYTKSLDVISKRCQSFLVFERICDSRIQFSNVWHMTILT